MLRLNDENVGQLWSLDSPRMTVCDIRIDEPSKNYFTAVARVQYESGGRSEPDKHLLTVRLHRLQENAVRQARNDEREAMRQATWHKRGANIDSPIPSRDRYAVVVEFDPSQLNLVGDFNFVTDIAPCTHGSAVLRPWVNDEWDFSERVNAAKGLAGVARGMVAIHAAERLPGQSGEPVNAHPEKWVQLKGANETLLSRFAPQLQYIRNLTQRVNQAFQPATHIFGNWRRPNVRGASNPTLTGIDDVWPGRPADDLTSFVFNLGTVDNPNLDNNAPIAMTYDEALEFLARAYVRQEAAIGFVGDIMPAVIARTVNWVFLPDLDQVPDGDAETRFLDGVARLRRLDTLWQAEQRIQPAPDLVAGSTRDTTILLPPQR